MQWHKNDYQSRNIETNNTESDKYSSNVKFAVAKSE